MKRIWTPEKDTILRQKYHDAHLPNLAFRLGVTLSALKNRAQVLRLKRTVNVNNPWTDEHVAILYEHYADMPIEQLITLTGHDQRSIWNKTHQLGLRKSKAFLAEVGRHCAQHPNAIAHQFRKGQEPANKGKRIEEFMSEEGIEASSRTRFKKGQKPHNTKPIGHERIDPKDGYIYVKVSDDLPMQLKHRYVWEQANGEVPEGYVVAFRDGNRQNCDLSNLYLLSREDNARRRVSEETPEARKARVAKATATRNKSIRRDKIRLHWGMEPIGKLVKRW